MKKYIVFLLFCFVPLSTFADKSIASRYTEQVEKSEITRQSIDIRYPVFRNEAMDSEISTYITSMKNIFLSGSQDFISDMTLPSEIGTSLNINYALTNDADNVISVKLTSYLYTGGAHGMPGVQTFVFNKKTGKLATIKSAKSLEKISRLVRKALAEELKKDGGVDQQWLTEGTAPTLENYANFTVQTKDGDLESISFYFQPYQVAAYASGMPTVTIYKDGTVEVVRE